MSPNGSFRIALAVCGLLSAAAPAAAQFVQGRVLHTATDRPLDAVSVELRTDDGRRIAHAVTDTAGRFLMQSSRVGEYVLVAERIGLQPVTSMLQIRVGEQVDVLLRMSEAAVSLEALTVEARSHVNIGPLAGYYERVRRNQLAGIGHIITREEIDRRQPSDVTDLLRMMPRVRIASRHGRDSEVRFSGRGDCTPKVYIDGMLTNRRQPATVNDLVHPLDLEGVEVYQGLAQMPGEYSDLTGCGVVLLWTRRTNDGGRPFSWRRVLIAGGLFGVLLLLSR